MARLKLETSVSYDHLQQSEKPLPPTPRRASSLYSASQPDQDVPYDSRIVDQYLSTEYLQPKIYRSSASEIPDSAPTRPKLVQLAQTYAVSDPIVEWRRADRAHLRERDVSPCTRDVDGEGTRRHSNSREKDAQWHADNYESVLHARSTVWLGAAPDPYYPHHNSKTSPMSPRITDVVDHMMVPSPLRSSTLERSPKLGGAEEPGSRFSSDSSEAGSMRSSIRDSLKKTARKAFHGHKNTGGDTNSQQLAPPPKPKSRVSSESSARRISIQYGIDDMYDTLTSLYSPSTKHRPASPKPTAPKPAATELSNSPKVRLRGQHRNPAIPISPYQQFGPKAWEQESQSSKSSKVSFLTTFGSKEKELAKKSVPMSSHSTNPTNPRGRKKPSLAHRLASTLQNGSEKIENAMGLETNKVKRTKSQKKREALKKQIVIVGLGDQQQAGGGRWV